MMQWAARFRIYALVVAVLLASGVAAKTINASYYWGKRDAGVRDPNIQSIALNPHNTKHIWAASSNGVFYSDNSGQTYLQKFFSHFPIHDIHVFHDVLPSVLIATESGVYQSLDQGVQWEKFYDTSDEEQAFCLSLLEDANRILIGTKKGLISKDKNARENWSVVAGPFQNEAVYRILSDGTFYYILTAGALYRTDHDFEIIDTLYQESSVSIEDEEEAEAPRDLLDVTLVHGREGLLLATQSGLLIQNSAEDDLVAFPASRVPLSELTSVVAFLNTDFSHGDCQDSPLACLTVVIGTTRGVFVYDKGTWETAFKGLPTNIVKRLVYGADNTVYAATDKGIYALPLTDALSLDVSPSENFIKFDYKKEPDIARVHAWAVDYAEVHPEKIRQWRRLAKKRAWLPSMSVGMDSGQDWDYSDSLFGSSTGAHFIGPDDKSYGRDMGFDVSLSWDLADLVWSTDQTTIDSRSKLMVELREDVLNQVTRLYFERRRLQMEMEGKIASFDASSQLEKQLRLEEMTAYLDAFTEGKFSEFVRDMKMGESNNLR